MNSYSLELSERFKKEFKKLVDNLSKYIDREEVVYTLSVMMNAKQLTSNQHPISHN